MILKHNLILQSMEFHSRKLKQFLMMIMRLIYDPDHSEDEDRFILLGLSCTLKILTVVHCIRDNENNIRIISAR